jgi:predicted nucleic acid-binding protein
MHRRGRLDATQAELAAERVVAAPVTRITHRPLLHRVWELRDVLTAYDAVFVALAERLGVPLLTCDGRLGRAHGHRARVEIYP